MGRIDILGNNAGAMYLAPFVESSEEAWRAEMELNVIGPDSIITDMNRDMYATPEAAERRAMSRRAPFSSPPMPPVSSPGRCSGRTAGMRCRDLTHPSARPVTNGAA